MLLLFEGEREAFHRLLQPLLVVNLFLFFLLMVLYSRQLRHPSLKVLMRGDERLTGGAFGLILTSWSQFTQQTLWADSAFAGREYCVICRGRDIGRAPRTGEVVGGVAACDGSEGRRRASLWHFRQCKGLSQLWYDSSLILY